MQKPKRNRSVLLLSILLFTAYYQAQQPFTYNSFLEIVRQNNPLSKQADNAGNYGDFQRRAARGNYDPLLSSNAESKQFNSSDYFTLVNAELKQPIFTSHYLKLGYQYGQGMYLNPENSTPVIGLPYAGLEASVLQGLFFDKRRAELVKAKYYSDFYDAEQKIQMNDLLFSASSTYAEALYARKVNSLFTYFASLAEQRLNGIKDLTDIGERPAVDTIEAAILLQGRMLDRQSGEIEITKRRNELLTFQAGGDLPALSDSLEQLYERSLGGMLKVLNAEQFANPVITQYLAKQGVLNAEKRLKRELIKPVLNLSYNFLNSSDNIVAPALNPNNYKWGASFSLPLFLRKPINEYRMANLDAMNNQLETDNKKNQIDFKRRYLIESIQITRAQLLNAEKSVVYSKLLVEAERLKFMNGESSLFLLNSRENKWLETELKLAEYRLKIIKSFLELIYVNGDLAYDMQ